MEIQRLQVSVTDRDLNDLAARFLPPETSIEDLQIALEPDGVRVKGAYHLFAPVRFDALWEPRIENGQVVARLASFRTMGIPGNVLKSLVMNVLADAAKKEPWLAIKGDEVHADIDGMLAKHGLNARTRLTSVRSEAGKMILEAGN
jgi:hypothetical protein